MKIIVSNEETGMRLDHVLNAYIKDLSRSQIQNTLFARDRVFVNGKTAVKNHRVKEGDTLVVEEEEKKKPDPVFPVPPPKILFENGHYIVLDKPSGLVVHGARDVQGPTLVDFLTAHTPQIAKVGDDPVRPGIVHRLDKDASGVMVVAKTQIMFDALKRQFKLRRVKKQYLVLTYGIPAKLSGEISFALSRSRHSPRIVAHAKGGRSSLTQYWVEKQFGRYALIRVEPHTGRTHQIRVHFFAFGYPIVGDLIYIAKNVKNKIEGVRLMLHATLLGFHDHLGVYHEYECEPDKGFLEVIKKMPLSH
ncbi:RluA family pseudouridine synthase [Candidatus Uhrbacteria bacterium]|nr:RluA family pseudouridine synthase [Candidatus Uhrbacteria bacterium]